MLAPQEERDGREVVGGLLMPSAVPAHVSSVGLSMFAVTLLSPFVVSPVMRFPPNLDGVPVCWLPGTTPRALPWMLFLPPDLLEALGRMWASSLCSLEKVCCPPAGLCSSKSHLALP